VTECCFAFVAATQAEYESNEKIFMVALSGLGITAEECVYVENFLDDVFKIS